MPKHAAHSSRAMYLSLSASHSSKKRVVQCSMGMRGARRGESSVWVRYLQANTQRQKDEDRNVYNGNEVRGNGIKLCKCPFLLYLRNRLLSL